MKLHLMPEAEDALFEIGIRVEERNTAGSGIRFINKFIDKIASYALPLVQYPVCKNQALASHHYSCITINDWVVAFKCNKNEFIVYNILYGPALK